ncbi:MAG: hypothetical protein M3214_13375 [Actinomycetota bacterium]|nr:hypothetical protein [Actinomycetota bacterium]
MSRREGELTTQDLVAGASDRSESDVIDVDRGERYSTGKPEASSSAGVAAGRDPSAAPIDTSRTEAAQVQQTPTAQQDDGAEGFEPLLSTDEAESFRSRWQTIQAEFVDEPRRAAEDADRLVAELMTRLAETFSEERSRLEAAWGEGDEVSTEDLRVAVQRYKSFFNRLLSV